MIYDFPELTAPIRQGDIFIGIPRIDISLKEVMVVNDQGPQSIKWEALVQQKQPAEIIVPVRPVAAIVATQDCDAIRSPDITLCEIREFRAIEKKSKDTASAKGWKSILTQHARINQKWFYLPPDEQLGFSGKMGVDFLVTLRVPREDLENFRSFRCGRLNDTADEHFRERIGEFFRRYPYDEWYILDKDEFKEYKKEYQDVEPFSWQAS